MYQIVRLLDVDEVASALRVSSHSVRRWAKQGALRPLRLGSRMLFHPDTVADLVERARQETNLEGRNQSVDHYEK